MLGWRILGRGQHRLDLPVLSRDEEELILAAEEGFKEAARSKPAEGDNGEMVRDALDCAAKVKGVYLERRQREYLGNMAAMHICGFAFLDPLLGDAAIEEISITGPGEPAYVYVRGEGWKTVNAAFESERAIADIVNRMGRNLGRHITLQNPRLDAMLPDGSRLHASLPPISRGEMTIRRFRERPFSPKELAENGTVSAETLAFLSIIMQCDCSLIVAGNTASGKTTTLNSLFSFTPANERVVITEETPEINIPHRHRLRLVANKDMGITLKDLVYDTLRMRPDRMIVGEVRNREEVEALFDVLLAGQARGCYATFHAQSSAEALSRLRSFGIRENDLGSIDCILVQRRMLAYDPKLRKSTEVRRVVEVAELETGSVMERACGSFGLDRREMAAELKRREKLIMGLDCDYGKFYAAVQKELYCHDVKDGGNDGQ